MRDQRYSETDAAQETQCVAGTAVTFLLIGLGAGALLGMLYSPGGKQMRKQLRRRVEDFTDNFSDWKEQARDFAEEAFDRGSDFADTLREKAAPFVKDTLRRGRF